VSRPYDGLQVLEIASSIGASYCGKLFVDAGADVVKLEPRDGDPLRRWTMNGSAPAGGAPGALFQYLNAGKRSVFADGSDLLDRAQLAVLDGSLDWTAAKIHALADRNPRQVVVSISPFGLAGPYADAGRPANEFILQAMCGSLFSRGLPEGRPLQAGGRIGEWVSGTYGAVAAAAVLRRARTTGAGDLVDVSTYEAMISTMGGLGAVSRSVLGVSSPIAGRSVELPSIVATADGLVGFCTITRQQFLDFLVMIGRADLLDDEDLATAAGRMRRRAEFEAIVNEWTATRTTDEIVELAASMRIPVAPIGTPETVAAIDHFAGRGVFVAPAQRSFVQPRVPYGSAAIERMPFGPVPAAGEHTGLVDWTRHELPSGATTTAHQRPLAGVRVMDLTAFWAGPVATHVLAALGADVIKVEGLRRPDGMRYSGGKPVTEDRWWEWGPVFLAYNTNKRGITLELSDRRSRDVALRLAAECDLVIENFSPRVMTNFGLDWLDLHAANPRLVMVRMPAFGLDGPWRDRVGFAQTMEQASGMAWLTGERDGPPLIPRGPCDPISGLHAAFAAIAGLEVRDRTGAGLHIESVMVEAALNIAVEPLIEYAMYGLVAHRDGNRGPGAAPQGVYRCTGADEWIALAVTEDAQWECLLNVIGRPPELDGAEFADAVGRRTAAEVIDAALSTWAATVSSETAEMQLRANGVPSSRVYGPDQVLGDEQLAARGFWERVSHPVVGSYCAPNPPFRLARSTTPWFRTRPPTLGEHNVDVLTAVVGLTADEVLDLERSGLIGVRPYGA
jgi:crotonobetainyl-CoA:carnitine CoA-transferase CaiB-like acyl-CoA transferase